MNKLSNSRNDCSHHERFEEFQEFNTIGKNASQYTVNKLTYIHSLYINKYNDI